VGWVDTKTDDPVDDKDVCGRYKKEIMNYAGVHFFDKFSSFFPSFHV
jgi:fatty acid synthase subunit beta